MRICVDHRDEEGAILPLFALLLTVIVMFAGAAVDYGRATASRSELQAALDAAVLAAAHETNPELAQATGQRYFESALQASKTIGFAPTANFQRTGSVISATAATSIPTTLMRVVGYPSIDVEVSAVAETYGKGMELMLVVDVSGSMNSRGKIGALRTAANTLVDAIYGNQETRPDTWIGLTPFSGRVNIFDYGSSWMTGSGPSWSQRLCADRRSWPNVENDEPPSVELFPYYWATSGYHGTATCPSPKALGLTAAKSVIKSRISGLVATAGTSTQVGMVWGWRMLSPKWQGLWGDPELPMPYADTPGKYVIIMTDGENFTWESDDPFSDKEADERLLRECQAMKSEGITVFTVAFDMGSTLTSLYQDCATQPDYHFDVQNNTDLISTFEMLGLTIAGKLPRLTH